MNSGQSSGNATVTIEKWLMDKYLAELAELTSNNVSLRDTILQNGNKIHELQDKIQNISAKFANQTDLCQQLRDSKKSLQKCNEDLQNIIRENKSLIENKDLLYEKLEKENKCNEDKIQAMEADVLRFRELLSQKETDIRKLQEEMHKASAEIANTTNVSQQLRDLKKSLQQRNDALHKENDKIRRSLSDVQMERNNFQKRIEELTSDLSKLQSELQQSKTSKTDIQSDEIQKQLRKLTVETDKIKSAVIITLENSERVARISELKKIESEYNQNVERLRQYNLTTTNENFNSAINKYRNFYDENNNKMKIFMKKLYHIEVFCKNFSESLEKNSVEVDKDMLQSLDENLMKLGELKRIPFIYDFQKENWLYEDILKVNSDTKINLAKLSGET